MEYINPLDLEINPVTKKKFSEQYYEINNMLINDYKLPMLNEKIYNEFKSKMAKNDIIIVESTTGSGKSISSAPIIERIYDYKIKILISQPRTVNIESTAEMISKQMDLRIGEEIGYQYSGGHKENPERALVHVVTDFFLIKLLNSNEESNIQREVEGIRKSDVEYDVFIVDEVHERNVNMDIFMTAMKMYYRDTKVPKRKKLILLSATLDVNKFKKYYEKYASVGHIMITKKTQPIFNMYAMEDIIDKDMEKYDEEIVRVVKGLLKNTFLSSYEKWRKKICKNDDSGSDVYRPCEVNVTGIKNSKKGDILVFIPTISRVDKLKHIFDLWSKGKKVIKWDKKKIVTKEDESGKTYAGKVIFSTLSKNTPPDERSYVTGSPEETYMKDGYERRVIFSTPIAETGITLSGIVFVIDTGVENKIAFSVKQRRRLQYLSYVRKPSVIQRCGRVGRREPGICIHLYTLDTYERRFKSKIIPKVYSNDIHSVFLTILYYTLDIPLSIEYMKNMPDPIDTTLISEAIYDLYTYGIIERDTLSNIGIAVINMGMDFRLAMVIIQTLRKFSEGISSIIFKHILPIIAILKIDPSLNNWIADKSSRVKFRNKYGDLIAMLKLYSHYYNEFVYRNMKWIMKKGSADEKMKDWCEKYSYNYYNIKEIVPTLLGITKKIKRGKEYYEDFNKLFSDPKQRIELDTIYRAITTIFSNVYSNNRAVYSEGLDTYILNEDIIGKPKSDYIDTKNKTPSMIGFIDLIYMEKPFPNKGMIPKLVSPFVIL